MKNSKEYMDKIVKILEPPYFRELGYYGIDGKEEWEYILGKIYGDYIIINREKILRKSIRSIYDSNSNMIYWENSKGKWSKIEYDSDGNRTYYENSNGEIIDKR